MKWISRILYILFILFVVFFVESNGGPDGFRRATYLEDNLTPILERENFGSQDAKDGLAMMFAIYEYYYFADSQLLANDATSVGKLDDAKFEISFNIYPFLLPLYSEDDGFIIILDHTSSEIDYFSIEIVAKNNDSPNTGLITISTEDFGDSSDGFTIINQTESEYTGLSRYITNKVRQTLIIPNSIFYNSELSSDIKQENYTIMSILLSAYIGTEKTPVYRLYNDEESFAASALYEDSTLDLQSSDYMISSQLEGTTPSESEIARFNIVVEPRPLDFSAYNYWYFIIYAIYFVLIVVIPYFWFFHRKIMANMRAKKMIEKRKLEEANEEQIFTDSLDNKDNK